MIRPHVHVPDPADLLGEACLVTSCHLKRSHTIHIDATELPTDDRYERTGDDAEEDH